MTVPRRALEQPSIYHTVCNCYASFRSFSLVSNTWPGLGILTQSFTRLAHDIITSSDFGVEIITIVVINL